MKQVIFVFSELTIVFNLIGYCTINKAGIPIWAGGKDELIKLLESVHEENHRTI